MDRGPDRPLLDCFVFSPTFQQHPIVGAVHERFRIPVQSCTSFSRWHAAAPGHGPSVENGGYDAILLLVPHKQYLDLPEGRLVNALKDKGVFYDLKSIMDDAPFVKAGRTYKSL